MRKRATLVVLAVGGAAFIFIATTARVQQVVIDEGPGIRTHRFWRVRMAGQDRRLTIPYNASYRLTEYAPEKLWGLLGSKTESGSSELLSVEYPVASEDK